MDTALLDLKKNAFINNKKKILSEYYDNEILPDIIKNLKDQKKKECTIKTHHHLCVNVKNINVDIFFEVDARLLRSSPCSAESPLAFEYFISLRIHLSDTQFLCLPNNLNQTKNGFLVGLKRSNKVYEIKKFYLNYMLKFVYYEKFNLLYFNKLDLVIQIIDKKTNLLKKLDLKEELPEDSGECCICFDMCGSYYKCHNDIPHYMCVNCYNNYNNKNVCPTCKKEHSDDDY